MKKNFKVYALCWAILLAVYNVVVFAVEPIISGYVINYDARFWIAWAFVIVAFIVNLISAFVAFKSENAKNLFYNISLINISYIGLILMTVFASIIMLIPDCPSWISAVVCIILSGTNAVAVISANAAAKTVSEIDEKITSHTSVIVNLTARAEGLLSVGASDEIKTEIKKVYEAIRYSDPMSSSSLEDSERLIIGQFEEFANAVKNGDSDLTKALSASLLELIAQRNIFCKTAK